MNRTFRIIFMISLAVVLAGTGYGKSAAQAADPLEGTTITVTTQSDNADADGWCSLREAIINANGDDAASPDCPAGSGNDTIIFDDGVGGINLSSGLPDITDMDGLSIVGEEMYYRVINGQDMYRILTVQAPLKMEYIVLGGGRSTGNGGAIYNDGGVLTLSNVTFDGNYANQGGAIYNAGVLILNNSYFWGNQAVLGGAIYNKPLGTLTVNDSIFAYSYAENSGGALFNSGILTVTGTTFYGNDATGGGGAISNGNGGSGTVINGLFYENSSYQTGGAILNSADLTVINSTFSENDSISGGGADIHHSGFNTLHLYNNIMANSQDGGGNCIVDAISGPPVVGSHNLIEDAGSTCGLTDGVDGNIVGVDPGLGTLAEYSNYVAVIPLRTGSPAINAGNSAHCPETDQRGVARPQGGHCDMGSFEKILTSNTITVTTSDDNTANDSLCSLREAIENANSNSASQPDCAAGLENDIIAFSDGISFIMISANLFIDDAIGELTIDGGGDVILSGGDAKNILIASTDLTLERITLSDGWSSYAGGAVVNHGTLTIRNSVFEGNHSETLGGAIGNYFGSVIIANSVFIGNDTGFKGGAIHNYYGTISILNSTFSENHAASGGAIYNNSGHAALTNNTFSGNSTPSTGIAVDIYQFGTAAEMNLHNNILANGVVGGNCVIASGTVTASHNLIEGAGSACGLTDGVNGNIIGTDPDLGTLTGSPAYIPLNEGSAAIDAGSDEHCPATDQRGVARPQGEHCDMGSYEYAEGLPTSATFADVPLDYWAWENVEILYAAGITGGCTQTPLNYCPEQAVTRAQMAIFLLRGIHGPGYTPPPATGGEFSDVPANAFGAAWIEQLVEEGITSGCGGGKYCPNGLVTRAQMAIFLLRAKHAGSYTPPPATGGEFSDVPANAFAAAWIEQLVEEGITAGCGGGKYCPNGSVTRAQMAVFLVRTFNLQP